MSILILYNKFCDEDYPWLLSRDFYRVCLGCLTLLVTDSGWTKKYRLPLLKIHLFRNACAPSSQQLEHIQHYKIKHFNISFQPFQSSGGSAKWYVIACAIVPIIWAVPDFCLVYGPGLRLEYSNSNPMPQIKQLSIDVWLWEYWNK